MEKKDLDKRVKALTTLTKDHEVAELAASYFDSQHPLPAVCFTVFIRLYFLLSLFVLQLSTCFPFRIIDFLCFALLSQREGTLKMFLFLLPPKPPRLRTAKMEMKTKIRWKIPAQQRRLLLPFLRKFENMNKFEQT
jgi:hypothetical protein